MAAAKNGSILQVHHPEHGWLSFVFPPEHAAMLGAARQAFRCVRLFRGNAAAIDGDCELILRPISTAHYRAPVCLTSRVLFLLSVALSKALDFLHSACARMFFPSSVIPDLT